MDIREEINKDRKSSGFTLMELLVAIAIIGIITVVVTAVFTEAKAKSRDSRRVSDIKTLHNALAMYVDEYSVYPEADKGTYGVPGLAINGSDVVSQDLRNEGILLSNIVDPRAGQDVGFTYPLNYYYYTEEGGRRYTITYCLETNSIISKVQGCGNSDTY